MDYTKFAIRIIDLKNADLKLRAKLIDEGRLGDGYNEEMEVMHNKNAQVLRGIIEHIGYPTTKKVGIKASEAAWLIIQHSIGQPSFMRACCQLLQEAVDAGAADPSQLAYLTDRIAVFEGRPQLYGTQFDWDENGELSPNTYDDIMKVAQRRKSIQLNTLEEQIEIMRQRVADERQGPPKKLEERNRTYNEWRKRVGWL